VAEIGVFEDFTSPEEENRVWIIVRQNDPDDSLTYTHHPSAAVMNSRSIRSANYVLYDSERRPQRELLFEGQGVSRVLKEMISRVLENQGIEDSDLVDSELLRPILESLNTML